MVSFDNDAKSHLCGRLLVLQIDLKVKFKIKVPALVLMLAVFVCICLHAKRGKEVTAKRKRRMDVTSWHEVFVCLHLSLR